MSPLDHVRRGEPFRAPAPPITPPAAVAPKLLRVRDAARYVACSERTLRYLRQLGTLRAVRIGRSVLFEVAALDALIAKAREGARP